MKEIRREYLVRRNGYYLQESDKEGMYYQVNQVKQATEFGSLESVISYIENDLKLNLSNVSIVELSTTVETTPLVNVNGEFLSIHEIGYCCHKDCKGAYKLTNLHYFQIDDASLPQLYCLKHFEELDSKWNNSYNGNQDSDVVDEVVK